MKHSLPITWHGLGLQLDLDGALYWAEERLLVAADLHLEKGTSFASSAGRLLPPYDSAQTVARLERLIAHYRPLRVVALGDFLKRIQGRIDLRRLDRVTPLAVPVLITLGSTEVGNEAMDALLEEAAADLIEEATSGDPGQEAML